MISFATEQFYAMHPITLAPLPDFLHSEYTIDISLGPQRCALKRDHRMRKCIGRPMKTNGV
jgi:hypothetical protein